MKHKKDRVRKLPYTAILVWLASAVVYLMPAFMAQSAYALDLPEGIERVEPVKLPELEVALPSGKRIALSVLSEGKLTVVHFWASWCVPCIKELPALDAYAKQAKKKGIKVVTISLDNQSGRQKAKDFYNKYKITHLPLLYASQREAMKSYDVKGLPTSIFVVNGKEVSRANTDLDWANKVLINYIEGLLSLK